MSKQFLEIYFKVKLEELRANDIGTIGAWVIKDGIQVMTHLTFPHFTNSAFYYSVQQIEQLEFSQVEIRQGNAIQNTVGLWFIAIEAYVNSILRIACSLTCQSFDEYKSKDFGARVSILLDILAIERLFFYKGPFQRLEEFKRYRNELFHDRTIYKPLEFKKTAFSGNPMYANQVDVIQAAVIAIEVFETFRFVISGLDLMPQVFIQKEDSFFYVPIDRLYKRVLRPHFEMSLSKHSLISSVILDICARPLSISQIATKNDVQILIKAIPDEKFNHQPSQEQTSIGRTLFDTIRNEETFDTKNQFKTQNYHRDSID